MFFIISDHITFMLTVFIYSEKPMNILFIFLNNGQKSCFYVFLHSKKLYKRSKIYTKYEKQNLDFLSHVFFTLKFSLDNKIKIHLHF